MNTFLKCIAIVIFLCICSLNWHCSLIEGQNLSIHLDSINNALLHTVDAFAFVETNHLSEVEQVGFCWNETGNPTIDDSLIESPTPMIHEINSTVGQLNPGTTYFIRAFARNG